MSDMIMERVVMAVEADLGGSSTLGGAAGL